MAQRHVFELDDVCRYLEAAEPQHVAMLACVALGRCIRWSQQHLTAHAQVTNEREISRSQWRPEELSAALIRLTASHSLRLSPRAGQANYVGMAQPILEGWLPR